MNDVSDLKHDGKEAQVDTHPTGAAREREDGGRPKPGRHSARGRHQ